MPCPWDAHPTDTIARGGRWPQISSPQDHAGPDLIVSNAPERLSTPTGDSKNLFRCQVSGTDSKELSVFVWHFNDGTQSTEISLRALFPPNLGGKITNIRFTEGVVSLGADTNALGKCIAGCQLQDEFEDSEDDISIDPTDETEIRTWTLGSQKILGALLRFTVDLSGQWQSQFRTVFHRGSGPWASPSDPSTAAEDPGGLHCRGYWHYDSLTIVVPGNLDLKSNVVCDEKHPEFLTWAVVDETLPYFITPPEVTSAAFGAQSYDLEASKLGNRGIYGANITYRFLIHNSDTVNSHAAYVAIVPRFVPQTFAAVQVRQPETFPARIANVDYDSGTYEEPANYPPQSIILDPGESDVIDVVLLTRVPALFPST